MSPVDDAYGVLGVAHDASLLDVRRAYRRLALKNHPDKNPDDRHAADAFAEIQKAYALLCDPEARAALDALLEVQRQREARGHHRSEKRQRMAEELEAREVGYVREGHKDLNKKDEAVVKIKLQKQIDRLKRLAEEREWDGLQHSNTSNTLNTSNTSRGGAREAGRTNEDDAAATNEDPTTTTVSEPEKKRQEDEDYLVAHCGCPCFPAGVDGRPIDGRRIDKRIDGRRIDASIPSSPVDTSLGVFPDEAGIIEAMMARN
jgi:curved DNA-binding protein CbpA